MKKPILLLIFLSILMLSFSSLHAQVEETLPKEKFSEFGINATGFVNEFISLNSNDSDIGDYMITYKYHVGKLAFRTGLGGRFSQIDDETEGGGNRTTKDNKFDMRVGLEMKKRITKRWGFYAGLDLMGGFESSKSTSFTFEEVKVTRASTNFGGGPLVGVQFFINSHISLATEGSLYFNSSKITEKEEFSSNPQFNNEDTVTNNDLLFGLPTSLFFIIRF